MFLSLLIDTNDEKKLFMRLFLENDLKLNNLLEKWIEYVNGKKYFPKLTVHLRTYSEKWKKSRKIKDAVTKSQEN